MEECAEGGLDYSGKCFISQSACYGDARAVADLIEERFPKLNGTRSQSSLLHPGMSGEIALYAKKYVNGMIIATG